MTRAQRAVLIVLGNQVIPALVTFGVVSWDAQQVAIAMGLWAAVITATAYFIPGSQPEPEVVAAPALPASEPEIETESLVVRRNDLLQQARVGTGRIDSSGFD